MRSQEFWVSLLVHLEPPKHFNIPWKFYAKLFLANGLDHGLNRTGFVKLQVVRTTVVSRAED